LLGADSDQAQGVREGLVSKNLHPKKNIQKKLSRLFGGFDASLTFECMPNCKFFSFRSHASQSQNYIICEGKFGCQKVSFYQERNENQKEIT
jgi:hypothetical protein